MKIIPETRGARWLAIYVFIITKVFVFNNTLPK